MNRKIHALIVEDDDAVIKPLSKKLKSMGHEFTIKKNQEDALSCIGNQTFDYVLLDLKLPVDSDDIDPDSNVGFNLLKQIREKYGKEHCPIIVMTAHEKTVSSAVEAMKKGANDFVEKPFKQGELERKISEILHDRKHKDFNHNPDYTWISLKGEKYELPFDKGQIIKVLHEAYQNGCPVLSKKDAMEKAGLKGRFTDLFKTAREIKQALIVEENNGRSCRLNI